eukprot:TRINITY_DN992_c0_g1_i3.p1 TRINITY_DN992_c0_g1~~TRINITY_DN992_c0_g1_i3.p1  ORF type:complete len:397 (-),score=82.61 TRINITY_DN992_c0_g1_i3:76-1266(-)
MVQRTVVRQWTERVSEDNKLFDLLDLAPMISDGMSVLVKDSFTPCFTSHQQEYWNWNFYLYFSWILGISFRYGILFPIRLVGFLIGFLMYAVGYFAISIKERNPDRKLHLLRKMAQFFCSVFVMSWSGVVKYHGVMPKKAINQVFVANHTTVFDICILQQHATYSIIGQKHGGVLGWLQRGPLGCLNCIWFERKDTRDRERVTRMLKEHIGKNSETPLLVFPEGTCVNNEYCIMFKKGAFELGATIYPVAIKYNFNFGDPFWNSRENSFLRHAFNLMTCWAVVCDVWYLEPQNKRTGESVLEFTNRVKAMIAKKAGLINVNWDGYLKYFTPNPKLMEERQREFAKSLDFLMKKRFVRSRSTTPLSVSFKVDELDASETEKDCLERNEGSTERKKDA